MRTASWRAGWRKSSYSAHENGCVEVDYTIAHVEVRDTKHRGTGPVLRVTHDIWGAFLQSVAADRVAGGGELALNRSALNADYNGAAVLTLWHLRTGADELHFTDAEWQAFRCGVLDGEFTLGAILGDVA